jgi:putative spermidine/putrescine transport system permease protein
MTLSLTGRILLRAAVGLVLIIIFTPLLVVMISSLNSDKTFGWPPSSLTLHWWKIAATNQGARDGILTSVEVGLIATAVALLLGTLAAFALVRYDFFGRDSISLLIVLPIALPGIVTGLALNSAFTTMMGVGLSIWTVAIAHATFCIVVVFNNVSARLRQIGGNVEEASMDLGASRWTTFRWVTLPLLRLVLLAGALLAFALSFDEIVVTTFTAGQGVQTLPIWIFANLFRPNQTPVINVVGTVLIFVSLIPIYLSQKLVGGAGGGRL